EAAGITTDNFPPALAVGASRFALDYHFEPGSARDGVTMTVPLGLLNQVPAARTEWLVPGLLREKVKALARSLPQRLRHKLGPLDAFAEEFSAAVSPADVPLALALARYLRAERNLDIPLDAWRADSVPAHLHMNFRVVDDAERQLGAGRDLAALKAALAKQTQAALREELPLEKYGGLTMGDLAEMME